MELYSYQKRVLESIEADPTHSQLISMPTGTGKTITFLSAIKQFDKPCLILVHRQELLTQTYEKALMLGFSEDEIAIITSKEKMEIKKLTIAMVPTLIRNLDRYDPNEIEMVVIDEAHHATAKSYINVLNHFNVFTQKKVLLGFTATPLRGDGKCLGSIFESHSFKMTLQEATQNGYICPVHGLRIEMKKELDTIDTVQGDYDIVALDKVMNCPEINQLIADKSKLMTKWPGIVFCTSIAHAADIAKRMRENGVKAISISYKTKPAKLAKILEWFKYGKIEVITNAVKLSEGFDFPAIETIILARPTRSPVLYKQMIGRGLRKSKDKFDCLVIEFSGNDEKMMCWEDIDENSTFQSITPEEKRTRDHALRKYRNLFKSPNISILDVKESQFKFYECNIQRMQKYKKYWQYIPHEDGFLLSNFQPTIDRNTKFWNCYLRMCMWKKKWESFYIWSEDYLWYRPEGHDFSQMNKMVLFYAKGNLCDEEYSGKGLGKWYPSEEEPMTGKHKFFFREILKKQKIQKLSARKAEMMIEDFVIKKIIDKFFNVKKTTKQEIYTIF